MGKKTGTHITSTELTKMLEISKPELKALVNLKVIKPYTWETYKDKPLPIFGKKLVSKIDTQDIKEFLANTDIKEFSKKYLVKKCSKCDKYVFESDTFQSLDDICYCLYCKDKYKYIHKAYIAKKHPFYA